MLARILRIVLPAVLAGTSGLQPAHADIYTWVDASGTVNVSNLAPPDGARVTSIIRAAAPATAALYDAAREAARQAEVQSLTERVRQLEDEVQFSSRQMPPADYRAIPTPPAISYVVNLTPPSVQYANVNTTPPANAGCDPAWMGCGLWWFYPPSFAVARPPSFRPARPVRGGHGFAGQQPPRAPWGWSVHRS